jgi:uncharacterized repeat protein (TIGR03803 family)
MPDMNSIKSSLTISQIIAFSVVLALSGTAHASRPVEQVLYSFGGGVDGNNPDAGLVVDSMGNLYGTTTWGGPDSTTPYGTVFELSPPSETGGAWTKTVLYSFQGGANDGATPFGTLIFDKAGNLYGTTQAGGSNDTGTVFELSPPAVPGDPWTETVLYIFPADQTQGYWPFGKLTFDGIGDLYGTTEYGGTGKSGATCDINGCGTVFQLKPPAAPGGAWTETVLYNFGSFDSDGIEPGRGVAFRKGSLYGTTQGGGTSGNGTVFRLAMKNGVWGEQILYNFTGSEGSVPVGVLIFDTAGNLFGTMREGGIVNSSVCPSGCGGIFELSPPAKKGLPWQENTLYQFTGGTDGACPYTGVIRDKLDELYGTTSEGGMSNAQGNGNDGSVFRLKPPAVAGGPWKYVLLRDFQGTSFGDGSFPTGDLTLTDASGLFGTTLEGGVNNDGTVFNLVP